MRFVRSIEQNRITSITRSTICEYIARLQEPITHFGIHDPRLIFNFDETGVSFHEMAGRSLRKGIAVTNESFVSATVKTKGKLDRVTVMCVINAAGQVFKPVVVYPGKQPHSHRLC